MISVIILFSLFLSLLCTSNVVCRTLCDYRIRSCGRDPCALACSCASVCFRKITNNLLHNQCTYSLCVYTTTQIFIEKKNCIQNYSCFACYSSTMRFNLAAQKFFFFFFVDDRRQQQKICLHFAIYYEAKEVAKAKKYICDCALHVFAYLRATSTCLLPIPSTPNPLYDFSWKALVCGYFFLVAILLCINCSIKENLCI